MNIRKKTLWWLPVYYLAASAVGEYLLIFLKAHLAMTRTVDSAGVADVAVNTPLSAAISLAIPAAVLLLGGFTLCRKLTRKEVALSAGILSALSLLLLLSELLFPGWDAQIGFIYALDAMNIEVAGLLELLLGLPTVAALIGCFTPMLFIPFGRKQLPLGAK